MVQVILVDMYGKTVGESPKTAKSIMEIIKFSDVGTQYQRILQKELKVKIEVDDFGHNICHDCQLLVDKITPKLDSIECWGVCLPCFMKQKEADKNER